MRILPGYMDVKVYIRRLVVCSIIACAASAQSRVRSNDEEVAAIFQRATEAQRAGQLDSAATDYLRVLRLEPRLAEASLNLGLVREEQGKYPEAIDALTKAVTQKPSLRGANMFLAIAEYKTNDIAAASKHIAQEVKLQPNDPQALMWMGVINLAGGELQKAASALDHAAEVDPKNVDILYHRGRAHLLLSQQSYQQMLAADPNSWRVHQVLAQSFVESDRDQEAIAEYEVALKLAPNEPGLNDELGNLYWKTGKLDDAQRSYEREVQLDPQSPMAQYKLGSLLVQRSQSAQAMSYLQEAVRLNPKLDNAFYYLGKAQSDTGDNEAALASLKRSLALNHQGDSAQSAYYQLSIVYRRLHQPEQARLALNEFEKLKSESDTSKSQALDKRKEKSPQPQ